MIEGWWIRIRELQSDVGRKQKQQQKKKNNNYSNQLGVVVQTLDSAIHWINHYPVDSVIDFCNTFSLDSDLSGG